MTHSKTYGSCHMSTSELGRDKKTIITGWKAVLIQAIVQAILVYAMSYFKLPRGFLHKLNMLFVGFWWGDKGSKRRIY